MVDRSGGDIKLHKKQVAVLKHKTISFDESEIPDYLVEISIQKPGSKNIS